MREASSKPERDDAQRPSVVGSGPLSPSLSPSDGERVADRPGEGKVTVVMVSRGDPKENRAKVKEHGLTFPIVLQQQWEISRKYAMFATPIAYFMDDFGVILHDVAVGVEPIRMLMRDASEAFRHQDTVNETVNKL